MALLTDPVVNFPYSVVATAPSPAESGAEIGVEAGTGARFAHPNWIVVWAKGEIPLITNGEIMRLVSVAGDKLTVERGGAHAQGSNPRKIVVGDQIAALTTAATWEELKKLVREMAGGNTAVGEEALKALEAVAESELPEGKPLAGNVALGFQALSKLKEGKHDGGGTWETASIAIGRKALAELDKGLFNVAIGDNTLGNMKLAEASAAEEREAAVEISAATETIAITAGASKITGGTKLVGVANIGNEVSGTGIVPGTKVTGLSGSEIALSKPVEAGKSGTVPITIEGGNGYAASFNVVVGHYTAPYILLGQHNTVMGSDSFGNNTNGPVGSGKTSTYAIAKGTAKSESTSPTLTNVKLPGYRTQNNDPETWRWGAVGLGVEVTGPNIAANSIVVNYDPAKEEITLNKNASGTAAEGEIKVKGRGYRASQNTCIGSSALEQFVGRVLNTVAIGISCLEQLEGKSRREESGHGKETSSDGGTVAIGSNAGARLRHAGGTTLIGDEAHRNGDTSNEDTSLGGGTLGAAGGPTAASTEHVEAHCGTTGFNVAIGTKALGADFGAVILGNTVFTSGSLEVKAEIERPSGASQKSIQAGQFLRHPFIEGGEAKIASVSFAGEVATITLETKKATKTTIAGEKVQCYVNTGCEGNVAVGYRALRYNVGHSNNTAVGKNAGAEGNTIESTLIGANAGAEGHHQQNVYIGQGAGFGKLAEPSGFNTAVGNAAMKGVTTGGSNVALGWQALEVVGAHSEHVAIGVNAAKEPSSGGSVAVGFNALEKAGEGSVAVGWKAGELATGKWNVLIGPQATPETAAAEEQLVIGNTATASKQWIRGEGGRGSAPLIGFLGAKPVAKQKLAEAPTGAEIKTALKNLGLVE